MGEGAHLATIARYLISLLYCGARGGGKVVKGKCCLAPRIIWNRGWMAPVGAAC